MCSCIETLHSSVNIQRPFYPPSLIWCWLVHLATWTMPISYAPSGSSLPYVRFLFDFWLLFFSHLMTSDKWFSNWPGLAFLLFLDCADVHGRAEVQWWIPRSFKSFCPSGEMVPAQWFASAALAPPHLHAPSVSNAMGLCSQGYRPLLGILHGMCVAALSLHTLTHCVLLHYWQRPPVPIAIWRQCSSSSKKLNRVSSFSSSGNLPSSSFLLGSASASTSSSSYFRFSCGSMMTKMMM